MIEVNGLCGLVETLNIQEDVAYLAISPLCIENERGHETTKITPNIQNGINQIELKPEQDLCVRRLVTDVEVKVTARPSSDMRLVTNGFQSWSFAQTLNPNKADARLKSDIDKSHQYQTASAKRFDAFTSCGVIILYDSKTYNGQLIGVLPDGKSEATLTFKPSRNDSAGSKVELSLWMDDAFITKGQTCNFQVVNLNGSFEQIISRYNQLLKKHLGLNVKKTTEAPFVVHHLWPVLGKMYNGHDVERQIQEITAMEACGESLVDILLLDDGWQASQGDHRPKASFLRGLGFENKPFKEWIDHIKNKYKKRVGAWVSPFEVSEDSAFFNDLVKNHPDWLLKDRNGNLISATRRPLDRETERSSDMVPTRMYLLDIRKKEVLNHLEALGKRLTTELGFNFLKLDYLFLGMHEEFTKGIHSATRVEIYRNALDRLIKGAKEGCQDTQILLSGAPIYASMGLNEGNVYMRFCDDTLPVPIYRTTLGPAVNKMLRWLHPYVTQPQKWFDKAIHTMMIRTPIFKGVFKLSPDGLCLDPKLGISNKLSASYMNNLLKLNAVDFPLITLGDDLSSLDSRLKDELKKFLFFVKQVQNRPVPAA